MKPIVLVEDFSTRNSNAHVVDVIPVIDDPGGPQILLATPKATIRLNKLQIARLHSFLLEWLKENG